MALTSVPNSFSVGATILSAEHNSNFNTIYDLCNGNLDNANIKASAGIVDSKLAQITTASKVSGAALTDLDSVPSGAGVLPSANGGIPVGSLFMWPTDTAPTGYLLCYGQAVSRTTYVDLFGVIDTVFGVGDGSTTFNVPDTRGRYLVGQDDMGGSGADTITSESADHIGSAFGDETIGITQIPPHTHTDEMYNANGWTAGTNVQASDAVSAAGSLTTSSAGGGLPYYVPSITVNYIIKT